jgi:hypothetical protein
LTAARHLWFVLEPGSWSGPTINPNEMDTPACSLYSLLQIGFPAALAIRIGRQPRTLGRSPSSSDTRPDRP